MRIFDKNDQPQPRPQFLLGVSAILDLDLKNDALMTLKQGYDVAQFRILLYNREMSLVSENMADQNKSHVPLKLWKLLHVRNFLDSIFLK